MGTRGVVLGLAVCAGLAAAAPAGASTTIGATPTSTQTCSANSTVGQDATAAGSASYTVPAGAGVITSWSYLAAASPGNRRLKVFDYTSTSGAYTTVGESALEAPTANQANTFATRISVTGGEILGVFSSTGDACRASAGSGNTVRGGSGDPAVGNTFSGSSLFASSTQLDVSAVVEPDGDGDGYGDETQDSCPTDPTVYATPCVADLEQSVVSNPASVLLGGQISYTLAVKNNGPTTARAVTITDTLPTNAALVSATDGCTGFATITCKVGDLASGKTSQSYTVVIRAPKVGALLNSVVGASPTTPDPVADNNVVKTTTTVRPPHFAGVASHGTKARTSTKNVISIVLSCPISARTCTGTLRLDSAKRVRLHPGSKARKIGLGSVKFTLTGGQRKRIKLPLTGSAQTVLGQLGSVPAVLTSTSLDAFAQSSSRTAKFTVLAPRKKSS
jgi:uncharacterized repeat protein (TIGR01451 family)